MSSKLVSVIMPAYNGEKYIEQAIRSVIDQSHECWELLVIDDGSTDNTAKIVASFNDPRIHYVFQQNSGQAAALNRGLDLAVGEYITTLDVDDWFTKDSLKGRVDYLELKSQYGAVYGDGVFCDTDGKLQKRFSELRDRKIEGDVYGYIISNYFYGTGANVLIRKSILDNYGIRYDESIVWCQDLDLYIRLAEICLFGFVDITTVWYRLHPSNMTSSMAFDRRLDSLFRTKLKVLASPRFVEIAIWQKKIFFTSLLLTTLYGYFNKQKIVMETPAFFDLPSNHRAAIMRRVVAKYIFAGKNDNSLRNLMRDAWLLNPLDLKSLLVLLLSYVSGNVFVRNLLKLLHQSFSHHD